MINTNKILTVGSSNHFHKSVCALKLMEELVELLQSQLCIHGLFFILLIQKFQFDVDKALSVVLNH
jgi:hypothetical protein